MVVLEEAWPFGNVSTEITYQVQAKAFDYLDAPIVKINTADTPAPYSPVLLKEWLPNSSDVVKSIKKVMAIINPNIAIIVNYPNLSYIIVNIVHFYHSCYLGFGIIITLTIYNMHCFITQALYL